MSGVPDDDDRLRKAIDTGAAVIGSTAGSVTGFIVGGPIGAIVGGALGPAIQGVLGEMLGRSLTDRERSRMGGMVLAAQERYTENVAHGLDPSNEFDPNSRSSWELLEGALHRARASYQEKKVRLLGNVYGNFPFVKTMPVDDAHLLLGLVEGLTYRQLAILTMISRGDVAGLRSKDYREGPKAKMGTISILQEIYDLSQRGLVKCQAPTDEAYDFLTAWHDIVPANLRPAPLGDALQTLAGLASIPPEDYGEIIQVLREG